MPDFKDMSEAERTRCLQLRLLNILEWFHRFCIEHSLTYYAIGGTLLGAVRHGGFIPWDDDLDVGMPRPDYNRFLELVKGDDSIYRAESYLDGNKDYTYLFCKVYDTTTTVVYKSKYNIKRGLFLDVFPLDGMGNTPEEVAKNYKKARKKNRLIKTKSFGYNKHYNIFQKTAIVLGKLLPYNWRKGIRKQNERLARRDYYSSEYVGNMFGRWGDREIMKREWYGTPLAVKFENIEILCPEDADSCLKQQYGDYMVLPPEEKRKPSHDALYMDLNKSYLDKETTAE